MAQPTAHRHFSGVLCHQAPEASAWEWMADWPYRLFLQDSCTHCPVAVS